MQTSGLVVTLASHARSAQAALLWLRSRPDMELGPLGQGGRLPVVLESDSAAQSDTITRQLERHAGVARVEVVFVGFPPDVERVERKQQDVLRSS